MSLSLFSCGNVKLENEVTIITPYGTPFLALGGLLNEENVKIDAVNGADGIKTALVKGEYDVVVAPINLASQLYNKGNSKYVIDAVITMNNAYIVTAKENKLDSINDLKNEKISAFGASGIPGNVLKTLYKNNNLDESLIDFSLASSSAVYAAYAKNTLDAKYVLMSEPEISKLVVNDKKDIKTLDLTKELGIDVPQACILVNPNSDKQEDIDSLLKIIENNIKSLNKNPEKYADEILPLDRTFEVMTKEVIVRSIPLTNIVYKKASSFKSEIENILTILGVANPNEEFYR
jgi:ABC-type nitrate/sulfonate/bicarbonate transport system substrate-binding protein